MLVHAVWALAWWVVGGLDAVYFCWIFPMTIWMWAGVLHIRFSHRQGNPVNMHWLYGLLFLGDHLHRDHHKQPYHANYATEPGQLDVGYHFIRLVQHAK
jgi:fatty-acid desaturase